MRNRYYVKRRHKSSLIQTAKRLVFLSAVTLAVFFAPAKADNILRDILSFPAKNPAVADFILRTGLGIKYDLPDVSLSPVHFFFPEISLSRPDTDAKEEDKQEPTPVPADDNDTDSPKQNDPPFSPSQPSI